MKNCDKINSISHNDGDCTQYEVVSYKEYKEKHCQSKGGDISMMQCQSYGEVEVKIKWTTYI